MIIGTAGHIDHGKTVLIKALTGVDTDRLKEEKKRGISIDLGFASFKLPSGRIAGVVDVPGHEHFVKNMLAGATGFDLVLLVVAADDGVMPQTREHLSIVDLLGVKRGVVAITKTDLVDDEMIDLVKEDIRELLKNTSLKDASIVAVSAIKGQGLDDLARVIDEVALKAEEKEKGGPFRLPIDRVFTLKGVGTVITGTLWSGELKEGDQAVILPANLTARIRSVQVHGKAVKSAIAGQRVAVNLPGIGKNQLIRGDVLLSPNFLSSTYMVDALFNLLADAPRSAKNWARLRLYHGTREVLARLVLLDRDEVKPGTQSYVQFRLEDPLVVKYGDQFIVRSYSPITTIGGGKVLDSHPRKHHRFDNEAIEHLKILEKGELVGAVNLVLLEERNIFSLSEIVSRSEFERSDVLKALDELKRQGKIKSFKLGGEEYYIALPSYEAFHQSIEGFLSSHHKAHPLEAGVSKELLRTTTMGWLPPKRAEALLKDLASGGSLVIEKDLVASRIPHLASSIDKKALLDKLEEILLKARFSPPSLDEIGSEMRLGRREVQAVLADLRKSKKVTAIKENLYFHQTALDEAQAEIGKFLKEKGKMTVSEFKDFLGTTRKYAVPLLEYFDRIKVTKREGDYRVLFS